MGFEPVTLQCWFKYFHFEITRSQVMNESGYPKFFRLHYGIAKIVFITVMIIASLDFTSTAQYMIHFMYHLVH